MSTIKIGNALGMKWSIKRETIMEIEIKAKTKVNGKDKERQRKGRRKKER